MRKTILLLTMLFCVVGGLSVSAQTETVTHYKPGVRKSTFAVDDLVFIYNTNRNGDRTGFLKKNGNSLELVKEKPYADSPNLHYDLAAGASVWKIASVETGVSNQAGTNINIVKLSIKPASADTYLKFDGTSNNAEVQYLYLQKWTTEATFSREDQNHENISGTSVGRDAITPSDKVWVVGNSATPDSYWNGEASRFVTYSKGHGYAFYTVVDASAEYQAKLDEAKVDFNAALTTGSSNYSDIKPVTLSDAAPVKLTADGNLFCNAEQTKTGSKDSNMTLSNLVDNGDNTSFHSSWQQDVSPAPSTWHYLQVNLAEATSFIDFTYRTRHDNPPYPTIIEIQCSSDNVNYVSVATFTKDADGLPQANATSFSSRVIVLPFASKYIRYVVKGNSSGGKLNGYPYFALSAFGLNTYTISDKSASQDPNDLVFYNAYYNLLATAATINEADNSTLLLSDVTSITEKLTTLNNKYGVYTSTKDLDFITVDPASPKYFAIKSGRTAEKNDGTNWMWTLKTREGGKIKIESMADDAAVSNNVFTYWSLQKDYATGYLKLIPYIEPSQPMGYTTVGDDAGKLTNVSTTSGYVSDLYEYVASGNTNYPHALKPAGGNTYVSNIYGTGSYMGFYNVLDDHGTRFAVVSQSEIAHIENLRTLNTTWKNSSVASLNDNSFGTGLNQLSSSCKPAYDAFVSGVNAPLSTQALTELTDDQLTTLTSSISSIPSSLVMTQPATGKFYRFKSVKHNKRLRSNVSNGVLQCGDATDNGRESIFYLTADNKLVAYVEGQYIGWNKDALANVGDAGYVTAFRCGIDYASYTIATVNGDNKRAIYCNGTTWDRGNLNNNAHTDSGYDWVIEEVPFLPVGVNTTAGYGTLYSPVALEQSDNRIKAYTGAVADGVLKLTPVEGTIPQNTPVIFQYLTGEENGKVFLQVMGDVADADYANNGTEGYLAGQFVTTAKDANASIYTLQNGSKGIGMYKYNGANIQGFRAYLPYTAPAEGGALRMVFDDVTTGIEGIEVNDGGKTAIYDLSGRRVSRMTKGLYIVNGKKVFIK